MKSPPDSAPDATPPADETQSPAQIRPRVPHDSRGVQAAMDVLDIAVRYNVRSQQTEVKLPGGFRTYGLDKSGVWERLTREQIECLRQLVKDKFTTSRKQAPARFSFDALLAGLQFSGQTRKVEPFAEYLESRPPWDRRPRLKTWLHRRALSLARPGDELQERLAEWASEMIPSLAVWRTFWPRPVKSDEHPILVGPHRAGKSTVVSRLLPPGERLNWHTDGLRFDDSPKRQMELLSGRVLVELAELQGLSKAQIANVKTFMTRLDDGVARRAWGRSVRTQPRRAVLIGTGNVGSANLPNDAALMRRFVPIDVDEAEGGLKSARRWLDVNRDQIWAEALHEYRARAALGKRYALYMPQELFAAQDDATERHKSIDGVIEDLAWEYTEGWTKTGFKMVEIMEHVTERGSGLGAAPLDKRVAAVLRSAGYDNQRSRIEGRRVRLWCRSTPPA